jgi:3-oxoacyl-[acyl-carrier protein] reductase
MRRVLDLKDRVVVVTGGASGIGRTVVRDLLAEGARVASLDLDFAEPALAGAGDAGSSGSLLEARCDVSVPAAVDEAIRVVAEHFGGIDALVQCAGITDDSVHWKMSDEAWQRVLGVNLSGAFHVLRAVTPHLRARGAGAIVHVTSINGMRGKFGQANYAASKAGLLGLTKTAARELGAFHIRVNAVAPGMVRTAMTETLPEKVVAGALAESVLDRLTEPEDVSSAVLFLLSDMARQITGETLRVDAGQYI